MYLPSGENVGSVCRPGSNVIRVSRRGYRRWTLPVCDRQKPPGNHGRDDGRRDPGREPCTLAHHPGRRSNGGPGLGGPIIAAMNRYPRLGTVSTNRGFLPSRQAHREAA